MSERGNFTTDESIRAPDLYCGEMIRPGEYIYQQGQPADVLVVLESGDAMLRVSRMIEGKCRNVIVELVKEPHAIIGLGILDGDEYPDSAVALTRCRVVRIPKDELFLGLAKSTPLLMSLLGRCARSIRLANERIFELNNANVEERVEQALKVFVNSSGFLPPYAKRQLLAEYAGCTRESVVHTLTKFESLGKVKKLSGWRVKILELDKPSSSLTPTY